MDGLGRLFNVAPIAAGVGLAMKDVSAYTFVCTGNDTFTVTVASSFGGSYATPGSIITRKYTNPQTNGTGVWTKASQTAANTVVIASGSVAFTVYGSQLADPANYVKVAASAAGLVTAIAHDLTVQRNPANLPKLSA
jgi:hypothetical protein